MLSKIMKLESIFLLSSFFSLFFIKCIAQSIPGFGQPYGPFLPPTKTVAPNRLYRYQVYYKYLTIQKFLIRKRNRQIFQSRKAKWIQSQFNLRSRINIHMQQQVSRLT